ncbi:hypothetical protein ACPEIC_46810 [Stenotrophomonas sp. NPDC087984]
MYLMVECGQGPQDEGAGPVVVPDRGGRENALGDADGNGLEGPSTVLFQIELALERVIDGLDQLPYRLQ